jgi:ParB family chromosome partitioning protein
MSAKTDRKSLLRDSIRSETASVEKRFPANSVDKRYADADGALANRPQGLVGPEAQPLPETNLRAEIATHRGGKGVLSVEIDHAHDNPLNARQIYDPEVIKSFAASLATRGQLVPAPAVRHPAQPGHVILIDGHYRKRALLAAGKTHIDVVLQEVSSELEMYRMSFLINEERNGQSPLDNALAWKKLLNEGKIADGDGIAELTGLSPSAVAKTMALLKLPDAAVLKMREKPSKFGIAVGYEVYRFAKILNEAALLQMMDRVVDEDLSSRAVEQLRLKYEEAKPRKVKEVSRQYKIKSGTQQIGFLKEWDSGKVAFEITLKNHEAREALIDELRHRFDLLDHSVDTQAE